MNFLSIKDKESKITLNKDDIGVVLKSGMGILTTPNFEFQDFEVPKNTHIKIDYFDFRSNKVIIECVKDKTEFKVIVPYSFLIENCLIQNTDKDKPVFAVHVYNVVHSVVDSKALLYFLITVLVFACGLLVGKVC